MNRVGRFGRAILFAALVAGGMVAGTATLEAKPKPDGNAAVCAYLLEIINYAYVNPTIKAWAVSLYTTLGCTPALP